jgi:hypothetical protein
MRRIKTVGAVFIAVFAITAIAAAAASAAKVELGSSEAKVEAEQIEGVHIFSVDGSNVECKEAKFVSPGNVLNGATKVVVHPVYNSCSAFGFVSATVTTTGCNYELTAANESPASSMKFPGTLVVNCGTGHITIAAGTCEAQVGNQTVSSGLTFENTTVSPMDVDFNVVNAPVATNKTADGFLCPFNGTGTTTGTYNGKTTVRAFNVVGGAQVNLTAVNN